MSRFDSFVAIDLETTGLDPSVCEIIELGAVVYKAGKPVETYSQLIRPLSSIPPEITRLTGIDDAMVEAAPGIGSVIDDFKGLLAGSNWIIGHNIDFDIGFLKRHLVEDEAARIDTKILDTAALSRILFPGFHGYSLGSLISDFKIKRKKAHRALDDCMATAEVFMRLIGHLKSLPVSSRESVGRILFGKEGLNRYRRSLEPVTERHFVSEERAAATFISEPSREGEYPDNVVGQAPPERYEDYRHLDEAALKNLLLPGGVFSHIIDRFEYRPMQSEMSVSVARAFNNSEFHIIEAPTGIGKSIAYLIPASWWASINGERVVISTQTKNLQSQLFYKDIPLVMDGANYKFRAVLLKGRANYICLYKYHELLAEAEISFERKDRQAMAALTVWLDNTKTGDISECHGFDPSSNYYIWSRVSCEGSFCLGQQCRYAGDCFLLKVRKEASTAQVVIVNHHLTFADFASGGDLVRDSGNIIFDEAHNLETVAASYLGGRFDRITLDAMLAEMFNPRAAGSGFLIAVKSSFAAAGLGDDYITAADRVMESIISLGHSSHDFFDNLRMRVRDLAGEADVRELRISEGNNPCESEDREKLIMSFDQVTERLDRLIESVRERDQLPGKRETTVRLEAFALDLRGIKDKARNLLYVEDPAYVYWIEIPSSSRYSPSINSAPLQVGELLDRQFYDYLKTAVFTSATLTVEGDFGFFKERLGLDLKANDRTVALQLDSPFDIDSKVAVISAGFLPSPKSPDFEMEAFAALEKILLAGAGKAMVLFTSHRSLGSAVDYLEQKLKSAEIDLFHQKGSSNSERILRWFKSSKKAVLFGTESFREGVDLPGELLELLVLFRLPFTVPDRPWFKANLERIEADGLSSFAKLSLPDAVMRFRQGFGRLIRTARDRGCVVILDSRIEKSSFGRVFKRSVRGRKFSPADTDDLARIIRDWLAS